MTAVYDRHVESSKANFAKFTGDPIYRNGLFFLRQLPRDHDDEERSRGRNAQIRQSRAPNAVRVMFEDDGDNGTTLAKDLKFFNPDGSLKFPSGVITQKEKAEEEYPDSIDV